MSESLTLSDHRSAEEVRIPFAKRTWDRSLPTRAKLRGTAKRRDEASDYKQD